MNSLEITDYQCFHKTREPMRGSMVGNSLSLYSVIILFYQSNFVLLVEV